MIYNRDQGQSGPRGYRQNKLAAAYKAHFEARNWKNYCDLTESATVKEKPPITKP